MDKVVIMDKHLVQNCSEDVHKLFGVEIGHGSSQESATVELAMATKDVSDGKGTAKVQAEEVTVAGAANMISNVDARTSRCKRGDGRKWRCKQTAEWPNSMCDICREKKRAAYRRASNTNKRNHGAAPVASTVITPKASQQQKKKKKTTKTTTKRKASNWDIDDHLYYGGFAPSSYNKRRPQSHTQAVSTNGQTTGASEALMIAASNNGMKWLKVRERSRGARRPANAHSLAQAIRAMIA